MAREVLKRTKPDVTVHHITGKDRHVSLSRPFVLRFHHIDTFIARMRNALKGQRSFDASLQGHRIFVNDEGTRTFGGLLVSKGKEIFQSMIRQVDKTLEEFRQPPYYKEAIPHISVVWRLGAIDGGPAAMEAPVISKESRGPPSSRSSSLSPLGFRVSRVECRIGNRLFDMRLL